MSIALDSHSVSSISASAAQNATVDNLFAEGQSRWAMGPNPAGTVFTNCLFGDGAGVMMPAANGGEAGDLNTFEHCTFYDGITFASETAGATNNKLHNCIVMSLNKQSLSTITTNSNYNLFPANSITRDVTIIGETTPPDNVDAFPTPTVTPSKAGT